MIKLICSIVALYFGACIYPFIRKHPALLSFFDAFVLVSIIGLTLTHLIPHSIEAAGGWALLAAIAGFGILSFIHFIQPNHKHGLKSGKQTLIWVAFAGIIIHTLLDGMALGMSVGDASSIANTLGIGVLFHRLPVGIFFAMILMPSYGAKVTFSAMTALALSTLAGASIAHFALPHMGLMFLNLVQALIAGSLLHVVFHNISVEGEGHGKHGWALSKGMGAIAGLLVLVLIDVVMPVHEDGHGHDLVSSLLEQLSHIAPYWLAATALMGIAYALKHKNHHIGCKFVSLFDPQPTPGIIDTQFHCFNAIALVAAAAFLNVPMLTAWFIGTCLLCAYARQASKHFDYCNACQRYESDQRCTQQKSFGLWLATSWMQLFIFAFAFCVLPMCLEPIIGLNVLSPYAIAGAALVILFVMTLLKRGLPHIASLFAVAVAIQQFEPSHPVALASLLCLAWGMGALFDYLPNYLTRLGVDDQASLKRLRRMKCIMPTIILASALTAGVAFTYLPATALPAQEAEHAASEHEMSHDADEHDEHANVHPQEHAEESEHEAHAHGDEHHDEHGHAHHHHESFLAHAQEAFSPDHTDMHVQLIATLLSVLLFILTGLALTLKHGPRKLFEMAMGQHAHRHEHEHDHDHDHEHEHEDHSACHEHECHECHEWHDHHEHHDHDLDEK